MKRDATPPERVHHARGPGDRPAAGGDVLTRRPQARRSGRVPQYGRTRRTGLFGRGKRASET